MRSGCVNLQAELHYFQRAEVSMENQGHWAEAAVERKQPLHMATRLLSLCVHVLSVAVTFRITSEINVFTKETAVGPV